MHNFPDSGEFLGMGKEEEEEEEGVGLQKAVLKHISCMIC